MNIINCECTTSSSGNTVITLVPGEVFIVIPASKINKKKLYGLRKRLYKYIITCIDYENNTFLFTKRNPERTYKRKGEELKNKRPIKRRIGF